MKKLLKLSLILALISGFIFTACRKEHIGHNAGEQRKPFYSSVNEFREGIAQVVYMIQENQVIAFMDTLKNGYPDIHGRKVPLAQFGYAILAKLDKHEIEAAVYDVFHFDGATFSLVSFLMKAQMAGQISAQTLATIMAAIPLPPIAVNEFQAPTVPVDTPVANCCDNCNPSLKILVTWTYKAPCGNYEREVSGYAANNTLTNMSGGRIYKFSAEVSGCPCPGGVLTSSVTAPAGASYGTGTSSDGSVTLFPVSSGTYTVTFTYTNCGKTVTKTFTLTIK